MPKPSGSGYSFKSNSGSRSDTGASKTTAPRNTPIPKPTGGIGKRPISHEQIAKRAYEIYASGKGGSAVDNWLRAESELKNS
jgi:DUF2934 family protein